MPVAVYARTSSDEQVNAGTIETQLDYARRYCELNNLPVYQVYADDGVSGTLSLSERPAGSSILQDAQARRFDTVLVYRIDRFGRNLRHVLNDQYLLEQADVGLRSMTEPFDTSSPMGRFMLQILAMFADLERSTIVERMIAGKQRVAREGYWPEGRAPYGYRIKDRRIEIDPDEAKIVQYIFRLYVQEKLAMGPIVERLIAENIPSPWKGRDYSFTGYTKRYGTAVARWHIGAVRTILRNSGYKGEYVFKKRNIPAIILPLPPLINEADWEAAQQLMVDNLIDATRNSKRIYPLTRIIRCGSCGYIYTGAFGGTKGAVPYYRCTSKHVPGRTRCNSPFIQAEPLETKVWQDIVRWVNSPGEALGVAVSRRVMDADEQAELSRAIQNLDTEIIQVKESRQVIVDLLRRSAIDEDEAVMALERHRQEVVRLQERKDMLYAKLVERDALTGRLSQLAEMRRDLQRRIHTIQPATVEQREVMRKFVERITVYSRKRIEIRYVFDAEEFR